MTNNVKEFSLVWRNLLPINELFGVVINSSEGGIRKSNARIFQFALERLGVSPKEALFLDGYANNIHPAEALGIRGVLVGADPSSGLSVLDTLL